MRAFGLIDLNEFDDVERIFMDNANQNIKTDADDYHSEYSIRNETEEAIYVRDSSNVKTIVRPFYPWRSDGRVVIQVYTTRNRTGGPETLSRNPGGKCGEYLTINIQQKDLLEGPIYVKEIDKIISLKEFENTGHHPFAEGAEEKFFEHFSSNYYNRAIYESTPFQVYINDPFRKYTEFYFAIGDEIVSIPVTHHPEHCAKHEFSIHYHKGTADKRTCRTRIYSFKDLIELSGSEDFWVVDGISFSHNKSILRKTLLERKKEQEEQFIEEIRYSPYDLSTMIKRDLHEKELSKKDEEYKDALKLSKASEETCKSEIKRITQLAKTKDDHLKRVIAEYEDKRTAEKLEWDYKASKLKEITRRQDLLLKTVTTISTLALIFIKFFPKKA
jgi:hypothetical protein